MPTGDDVGEDQWRGSGSQQEEIGITKVYGYYIALLASLGISAAGLVRSMEAQKGNVRKTPGTV